MLGGQKKWQTRSKRGLDIVCWLALIIIAIVIYSGVKTYLDNRIVNSEIAKLKKEVAKFEAENEDLRKSKEHGESENFMEKEARIKLNLQKSGEKVVFIDHQSEKASSSTKAEDFSQWANVKRWWQKFFP